MVDPDRVHVGSALDWRPLHQGQQRQGNGSAGRREDVGDWLQLQPVEAHSVGVTYAQIKNDRARRTRRLLESVARAGGAAAAAGEDPRFWSMTIRHAF
jgi:hypothetical protein